MTKEIWEGQDYLAKVWHEWVNAPNSLLRVGTVDGEIAAVGRAVELTPGNWWLEGLRVKPEHQGKGYATQLHNHVVALALQQPSIRTLGLATSWENEKVAHLARGSGMTLRGDYRLFKAPGLPDPVLEVTPHPNVSLVNLLARIRASHWLALSGGYAMYGWVARPVDEAWLQEIIIEGGVWRCGEALALTGSGSHHDQSWLYLLDGGSEREQEALVRHARYLAYQRDPEAHLRSFVPVDETLYQPLCEAGMDDPWGGEEGEFHVYHFVREK
ncbi:MAG: GNAT family N-acetyltransferase [Chloroflexota bacterium]|nr:GNAT family N-acetyltransferase [Chloroflexota bacterium]